MQIHDILVDTNSDAGCTDNDWWDANLRGGMQICCVAAGKVDALDIDDVMSHKQSF